MKKLLALSLLLATSLLHAVDPHESVTSGSVGLLIPTTGYLDTGRRLDDKYNANFRIIASSLGSTIDNISGIATATSTLLLKSEWNVGKSTNDTDHSNFKAWFSTANSKWEAHKSTADVMDSNFTAWFSTYQARSNSVLSSTQSIQGIQLRLATTTLVGMEEGSTLSGGNVTAINSVGTNITATQSGSTLTLTVTGGSSGGPSLRSYDLIVGSSADTPGIDMVVNTRAQFNMMLTTVQALGMTNTSTVTARILFRNGIYDGSLLQGVTVPFGITLVAGSSSVWVIPQKSTQNLVTIYGTMDGFKFDNSNSQTKARLIRLRPNGNLLNFEFYNSSGIGPAAGAADVNYCSICVDLSTNNKITGKMYDFFINNDQSGVVGNGAPFKIAYSSMVDIQLTYVRPRPETYQQPNVGTQTNFMLMYHADNINIHDGLYANMGGSGFQIESYTSNIFIERNTIYLTTSIGRAVNVGFFSTDHQLPVNDGLGFSTGTISVSYNHIFVNDVNDNARTLFVIGSNAVTDGARGWQVKNNNVYAKRIPNAVNVLTFATVNAQSNAALFQGNNINGISTFISDSGDATLYTSQGNTLATVQQ